MTRKQICLRSFLPEDQERILDMLTDNTVNKTYMLPDFANRADAIPLFERLVKLSCDTSRYVRCISADGKAVGFLNDVITENGKIELGYVIHPAEQRKGYMTAALKTAIKELLAAEYETVICGAFEENTASIRVMEKCGMHRIPETEIIEYRNQAHTCVYYAIIKENSHA